MDKPLEMLAISLIIANPKFFVKKNKVCASIALDLVAATN